MNDFIFHNPDKVYFGKNQLKHLSEELLKFGTRVLLVYGAVLLRKMDFTIALFPLQRKAVLYCTNFPV